MEAVGAFQVEVACDEANSEVYSGQTPCRGIVFLLENADVALGLAAVSVHVRFHEFNRTNMPPDVLAYGHFFPQELLK